MFQVSNKEKTYIILPDKEYNMELIKFLVNSLAEKGKTIDEIVDSIRYNFSIKFAIDISEIVTYWCD